MPLLGRGLMPVHAPHLHRRAVEVEHVTADLHFPQAHLARTHVAARLHHERVEVGILCTPQMRFGKSKVENRKPSRLSVVACRLSREVRHQLVVGVVKRRRDVGLAVGIHLHAHGGGRAGARPSRDGPFMGGSRSRATEIHIRLHAEVLHAVLRHGEERHVAEQTRHAEHVLILQIRPVAPAQHPHRQHVGRDALLRVRFQRIRHVELGGQACVLRVAHERAVEPHVGRRIHAVKTQDHATPLPVRRHGECAAVAGDGVVVRRAADGVADNRRVLVMRVGHVRVVRHAVAAHLHAARHVDRLPVRVVEVGALEPLRPLRGFTAPVEAPVAVQRHHPLRGRLVGGERLFRLLERHGVRAPRQAVDRIDLRILMG